MGDGEMRYQGREVLMALVETFRNRPAKDVPGVRSHEIAAQLDSGLTAHGNRVVGQLKRLERAGLAEHDRLVGFSLYRPTKRGIEVDLICAGSDFHRGGVFRPLRDVIHDQSERLAL
jgi:hypothetical protein